MNALVCTIRDQSLWNQTSASVSLKSGIKMESKALSYLSARSLSSISHRDRAEMTFLKTVIAI